MNTEPTLYLAPMRGLTDAVFRNAHSEIIGGFHRAVAPFFKTVRGGLPSNALRELNPEVNRSLELVPQLLGRNADDFLSAVRVLGEQGYREFNWNLGCPHRMVTNKRMGAGLLPFPEEVDRFLEKLFSSAEIALSVKTRLGLHDTGALKELMPVFNRYPLDELIVHPRTADQMYGGPVHLDALEDCLNGAKHQIVYSGDIFELENFHVVSRRLSGVSRWMLGRGAISDPFLALRIAADDGGPVPDEHERLRQFHAALYQGYRQRLSGPGHVIARMKGVWEYLGPGLGAHKKYQKKIKRAGRLEDYEAAAAALLDSL